MEVGKLNKRIDLIAVTKTGDNMGGFTESDATVASGIAAAIWPVSGKETIQNMQNVGTITHRVKIRYRRVLRPSWRVKFGSRYFAIVSPPIDEEEAHKWLMLLCQEVSA